MPDMKTLTVGENTYTVVDGSAVHFTEQTLTAEQRAQARKNIGIYSGTEIPSDWQEGDIFIDTDGGSQTVNLMENASVAVGAPGLITENVPNLSYYTEAAYSRATLNPLYFYAESGTLNVSLSDYSVYQFTVYCYSCDESAKDVDFSFTEGTIKYFEMNSSKVYESGWKTADFSLEINGTCLIALMFRRQDDANLDSADTAQIKTLLTATVTRTDDGSAESPEDTYELPIATADTLGGVKPVQKTEDMTQSVGVDEFGGLWTAPGGTVSGDYIPVPATAAVGQTIKVSAVDADGKVTAVEAVDMPGGESEADALVVVFTTANLVTGTASHSASEISSAAEAGKLIWGRFAGDDISGTPIAYLGSIGGKARFGITTTNVDFNGVVGATLIYVDDTKTLTITRGTYIMVPSPNGSDIGKTLAVDAVDSVAWQTPSGGVNPVQKTEDMTQRVGVDDSGRLWTAPGGVSSDAWELIADITLEEQVTSFSIDEGMDGEPFSLRKYLLAYAWAQVTDGSKIPSYMFLAENNRQYGESSPPLYTGAFNVASATGKTAGVIIAELLPNNVISEECWTTSVDASISLEPFQPIKGPMPNTYKNKVFKQDSNFAPFYQIGGSNGVLAAGSRIMLWGVRK